MCENMSIETLPDVIGAPEKFLGIDILQDALEYALGLCKPVEIVKIIYESGSRVGDNYLGQIYRIKVHYHSSNSKNGKLKIHNFIAKCIPNTEANAFMHECYMFLKEKIVYQEILPRLHLLHLDGERFGAHIYNTIKEPMETLIFEDLQTLGYCMASREAGLDLVHSSLVMQKLGKFHAISMLLERKHPHLKRSLHSCLISETMLKESGMPLQLYVGELMALEARIRTWPGYELIANKIQKFCHNFRENILQSVAPQDSDINVMNHGDLWVNNALFKYADVEHKTPIDVVFVDFQMSIWGSLGIDINYFFNTSVQLDVLRPQRLRLLLSYYDSLSSTLIMHQQQMQLKVPTFAQILHEVEKRESFGFFASFAIFPLISMDKNLSGDNSIDNLVDEEFARKKMEQMFESEKVQEHLKYTLRRFDDLGVLG